MNLISIRNIDAGSLVEQISLRNKLNCKPFKWFMENVAFDLVKYYPPVPIPPYAQGKVKYIRKNRSKLVNLSQFNFQKKIRNLAAKLCLDTGFKNENQRFGLGDCDSDGGEKRFELSWQSDIRPVRRNKCFDVSSSNVGDPVFLYTCHGLKGNQEFQYYLVIYLYLVKTCLY